MTTTALLQAELMTAIADWGQSPDGIVAPDAPLITSARLDSLHLFQLLVWIEEKVGRPIDATAIDIAAEWNTVDQIVSFIERARRES